MTDEESLRALCSNGLISKDLTINKTNEYQLYLEGKEMGLYN